MSRSLFGRATLVVLSALLLPVLAAACDKSNDTVALDQLQASENACAKGCEATLPGCTIKGNISTTGLKYYHVSGTTNYKKIIVQPEKGERWFCTEQRAIANGFTRKDN